MPRCSANGAPMRRLRKNGPTMLRPRSRCSGASRKSTAGASTSPATPVGPARWKAATRSTPVPPLSPAATRRPGCSSTAAVAGPCGARAACWRGWWRRETQHVVLRGSIRDTTWQAGGSCAVGEVLYDSRVDSSSTSVSGRPLPLVDGRLTDPSEEQSGTGTTGIIPVPGRPASFESRPTCAGRTRRASRAWTGRARPRGPRAASARRA